MLRKTSTVVLPYTPWHLGRVEKHGTAFDLSSFKTHYLVVWLILHIILKQEKYWPVTIFVCKMCLTWMLLKGNTGCQRRLPLHIEYGTRYNHFSQSCCQCEIFTVVDETDKQQVSCHLAISQGKQCSHSPQQRWQNWQSHQTVLQSPQFSDVMAMSAMHTPTHHNICKS